MRSPAKAWSRFPRGTFKSSMVVARSTYSSFRTARSTTSGGNRFALPFSKKSWVRPLANDLIIGQVKCVPLRVSSLDEGLGEETELKKRKKEAAVADSCRRRGGSSFVRIEEVKGHLLRDYARRRVTFQGASCVAARNAPKWPAFSRSLWPRSIAWHIGEPVPLGRPASKRWRWPLCR